MMVIAALGLEVQSNAHGLRERTEEVFDHFGRQISDMAVLELGFEREVRTTGNVECTACKRFIHRKQEAEAADAALVAQCQPQRFTERESYVFDRVVIVDLKVSLGMKMQTNTAVHGDLVEHVVEKADARGNVIFS